MAQSRFLTHTLVLVAAAFVPLVTAVTRSHPDTAYGAATSGPGLVTGKLAQVDTVQLSQGGFIMKMNASITDAPPRREVTTYEMKPGDTVANVAGQFGLTVATVRWANDIQDLTAVAAGQKLLIPPVNGVMVKVQPGMQLATLATRYHVQAQDVIDFNLLRDPEHLVAGSFLMLPDGLGPALDPPRPGAVTWNRFAGQTITYAGPATGSGGHFPYGYCTWWVAHKRYIPWSGNAWEWWYQARLFGFAEGQVPKPGAIMIIGISAGSPVGHAGYVESVNADGSFTVSEMNWGRWGVVDYRTIPSTQGIALLGFIY